MIRHSNFVIRISKVVIRISNFEFPDSPEAPIPPQRIEAITVCYNYSDFLTQTLPHNLRHFDHYIVVTHPDDHDTQTLCRQLGVECRPTDLMHYRNDQFAKARAIDYGLAYLRRDDWVVHLDADIYLPPMTRQWITWANPNPDCIYGIDRCDCTGYTAWHNYISRPAQHLHQHAHGCLTLPPPFPLSARISLRAYGGYVPIGFFQLWNAAQFPDRRYPLEHGSAEHTDVLHAIQWPAKNRRLLPELIAIHLASENAEMGANWQGRKTKPFGPHASPKPHRPYCK